MGFDVFAAGSENFHYTRKNCEDGSSLEMMKTISALQGLDFQAKAHLGISGAGAGIDIKGKGITDLMVSLAEREMLHNISNAMCILTMNGNPDGAWISIHAVEHNTFLPDVHRSSTYNFSPGDSPGAEFISRIRTSLEDTGMANFGVLMVLS